MANWIEKLKDFFSGCEYQTEKQIQTAQPEQTEQLEDNAYGYYKHAQSSTAQLISKEAFSVVRLGFLKVLQNMHQKHPEKFIEDAGKFINRFIEKKYTVIGNIVDKKAQEGLLIGYKKISGKQWTAQI